MSISRKILNRSADSPPVLSKPNWFSLFLFLWNVFDNNGKLIFWALVANPGFYSVSKYRLKDALLATKYYPEASCSPSLSYLWRQGAGWFLNEPTTNTNNQITFTLEWLADALNSVNYYCRNCTKTNFPRLIEKEREQQQFIYFIQSRENERGFEIIQLEHRERENSFWMLERNKGFTVKPYCSMQMDLYKNNLAAEAASTLCAFKNLFKSS